MKNGLQAVIDQIGIDSVRKSMGAIHIGQCDAHGSYGYNPSSTTAGHDLCPLCPHLENSNGTSATEVEHYLDIKAAIDPTDGNNPGVKANPYGL